MGTVEKENECTNSTAALGKTLLCQPHFTFIIKYDFKDARERLNNFFIDKTA